MPLDVERLRREVPVAEVEVYGELPSTNDLALVRAADAGVVTPWLIAAERQTAGRGRGAHQWWSAPGALTFSLLVEPGGWGVERELWPRLSLVVGLSVCQVVQRVVPARRCLLKWPNDVWLDERKVCGILVEVPACRTLEPRLVIGIGVNVNNSLQAAPEEVRSVATSLCDMQDARFDRNVLLAEIVRQLDQNLWALAQDEGSLSLEWQRRSALTGRQIEVDAGGRLTRGVCGGIDATGALLVDTAGGRERLLAGSVRVLA